MVNPPRQIGPYTLLSRIGSGGMGTVWEASGPAGAHVALKTMHQHLLDEPDLVERFRREYTTGRGLNHPNLVRMLDAGEQDGSPYLVMELVPGKSLRRLVEKGGPFHEWEVATIGQQLASALTALQAAGVVHRDFKSSNVMVDRGLHVKLIDFGIARQSGEHTSTGAGFIGSAEYSAPEAYYGRSLTNRSDIYALGIVFYEGLTGRVPFRSDRYVDVLKMHAELPVPPVTSIVPIISDAMNTLVAAMVSKNPANRPDAAAIARGCQRVLELQGRPAPTVPPIPVRVPRPATFAPDPAGGGRTLAVVLFIGVAAAAAIVGTAFIIAAGGR
jgi:serine/threonine-protein kinase